MSQPGSLDPLAVYPAFRAGRDALVVAAPAKLNLFLEIHRKRPDGYHDLESLMLAIDLFDTLEFQADPHGQIHLTCEPSNLSSGPDNLVFQTAEKLRAHSGRPDLGVSIRLTKRIPTQAGLAGGSSDAAIALLALNQIWKLGLTRIELAGIASQIGSDVAFFLEPPAGWCTGRGEFVTPVPVGRVLDFVLVCPPVGLATVAVYRQLAVSANPVPGGEIRLAIRLGDPAAIGRALFNRLEQPAFALSPVVEQLRQRLVGLSPCGAMMSGSGSAMFALCRNRVEAFQVAERFRSSRPPEEPESRVLVVRSLAPDAA
ncbi:MAG TPA: 4-(cytidine 5'-diphospho)-2-C-methyl-D-erythritol kinase [Gemmata sp.]|jgi:4-diphosphocytidyl-2-C-methyl-D-erythritol kinase|nr:4-(cytidine 5'-diphospho)-2-C-methyl-D-erythritol kinase [Gemmata sp.]